MRLVLLVPGQVPITYLGTARSAQAASQLVQYPALALNELGNGRLRRAG